MLRNQIKFAIRVFLKDGAYSVLNIFGLTLGISVGIILLLYLQNELNYDEHHEKKDQIYRFTHHRMAPGADFNAAGVPRELGPILKQEISDVVEFVRFIPFYPSVLITLDVDSHQPRKFYEQHVAVTDSSFLSVFSHEVLEGSPNTCLNGPGKAVVTQSIAVKYFGDESAIGKTLLFPNNDLRVISAVISDLPDNSHYKYEILLSNIEPNLFNNEVHKSSTIWSTDECYTYLLMPENYDLEQFYNKFEIVFDKYYKPYGDVISSEATAIPFLQSLTAIHYESDAEADTDESKGNKRFLYSSITIGFFIMLLSCINYINMVTARSVIRSREIGIRKVLGSTRFKLFGTMLLEAIVLALTAMLVAILISYIILEFSSLNTWIDKELSLDFIENPTLLLVVFGIAIAVGLVSGIYPALYIPRISAINSLKGANERLFKGVGIRKILIIFQFIVSITVILFSVLMQHQIEYLKTIDLGFNKDNVLLINIQKPVGDALKNELIKNPNIVSVGSSGHQLGQGSYRTVFMIEQNGQMVQQEVNNISVGLDYLNTIGLQLLQGRDFRDYSEDANAKSIIINDKAAKALGWETSPLNKRVKYFSDEHDGRVVGVVKDFNFKSLHDKIEPLFFLLTEIEEGFLHIRLTGNNMEQTIQYIEQVYNQFDPKHPFEYHFLDKEFEKQYKSDQIQQLIISVLSYIGILISILGLVGLSAYTIGQKEKEISIRKTLGASVTNILILFSKGYLKLILAAMIVAIPMADYFIVDWLAEFAYRVPIRWYYYLLPGMGVLFFGMITVLIQSFKSANANPIDGLRNE